MHEFSGIQEVKIHHEARLIGHRAIEVQLGLIRFETAGAEIIEHPVKVVSGRRLFEVVIRSQIQQAVNAYASLVDQPFLRR